MEHYPNLTFQATVTFLGHILRFLVLRCIFLPALYMRGRKLQRRLKEAQFPDAGVECQCSRIDLFERIGTLEVEYPTELL